MTNILGPQFLIRRDVIDEQIWAACDAFNAATDPDERATLRAMIERGESEQRALSAAREGGPLTDPADAWQVGVFLEAHQQHVAERAALARHVNRLIADMALAATSGRTVPDPLWRGLWDSRAWLAGTAALDAEVTRLGRTLQRLAEE